MTESPAALPILARGRHRSPARGACFLEYTAVLAGEPFGDAPACVDAELAAVLRHANDTMSAADRPRLVPLLGRAIGLVVAEPEPASARTRRRGRRVAAERDVAALPAHREAVGRLRREVSRRFAAALDLRLSPAEWRWYAAGRDVDRLFWAAMLEPRPVSTSAAYVDRLVGRLVLLHECYEQAMDELGLPRTPGVPASGRRTPAPAAAPAVAGR